MDNGNMKYLKNVVTLEYDKEKCIGCGMCEIVCPHHVFSVQKNKADMLDRDKCMECGACAKNCPTEAITVTPGVGCAMAVIIGWIKGTEPTCDCSSDKNTCCG
jgi:NAD-dependent dihydropyrimidine dehydrogenase PreA subunit